MPVALAVASSSLPVSGLPAELRAPVAEAWRQLVAATATGELDAWRRRFAAAPDRAAELATLWALSPQSARLCARSPERLRWLWEDPDSRRALGAGDYRRRWRRAHAGAERSGVDALDAALREFRQREWMRVVWRDSNGLCDAVAAGAEMSALAETCIDVALAWHDRALRALWGVPVGEVSGREQAMVALALGKLGGGDLNLSSDVDLMFAYEEAGSTCPASGESARSSQEFFVALGQRLIKTLDLVSEHGFVFRVDMRLRPFGAGSALALSFDAMTSYYQQHGRDWERYALIKARPVAGDRAAGARLMESLRPFVYRGYLDFGALESLREMHRGIRDEAAQADAQDDLKRSAGGIRDTELAVQMPQLVFGGKDPALRRCGFADALAGLAARGALSADAAASLRAAYGFLRRAENAVQAWGDQQTHRLPQAESARWALARYVGAADWATFAAELERHRSRVRSLLSERIARRRPADRWQALWRGEAGDASARALADAGFADADAAVRQVFGLRDGPAVARMPADGHARLHRLMPMLLAAVAVARRPDATLTHCLRLVAATLRRTAYFSLLAENPAALRQLVDLVDASEWLADTLCRHPAMLDELLAADDSLPGTLRENLGRSLGALAGAEPALQLQQLCHFRLSHVFRIAVRQLRGGLSERAVGAALTELAEAALEQALALAWREMAGRHGASDAAGAARGIAPGFLVVAYGRLGSGELGYHSDLDLVFVYDARRSSRSSAGADGAEFFMRLAQRLIHWLSAATMFGRLYRIDARLRPSGRSGTLVSSASGFASYQRERAWTWEHQALVNARAVAGDERLARFFSRLRAEILRRRRDPARTASEVRAMRDRMYGELKVRAPAGRFRIKHGRGGEVDIDFLVQCLTLCAAAEHPSLVRCRGTSELLDGLVRCGALGAADASALASAHRAYRRGVLECALRGEREPLAEAAAFEPHRQAVASAWARCVPATH